MTFTENIQKSLRTLYAQLFRATLAPLVLPRLLARSQPELACEVPSITELIILGLFLPSRQTFTLLEASIGHAALLRQGCPHCAKFLTAASRRSLGRISVPMWLIFLLEQLLIDVLVSHYLTN